MTDEAEELLIKEESHSPDTLSDERILKWRDKVKGNVPTVSRTLRDLWGVGPLVASLSQHKYELWFEAIANVNQEICESRQLTKAETEIVYVGMYIKLLQQSLEEIKTRFPWEYGELSLDEIRSRVIDYTPDGLNQKDTNRYKERTRLLYQLGNNMPSIFLNKDFKPETLRNVLNSETDKAKGLRVEGSDDSNYWASLDLRTYIGWGNTFDIHERPVKSSK